MKTVKYLNGITLLVPDSASKKMGSFNPTPKLSVRELPKISNFLHASKDVNHGVMLDIGANHGSYSWLTLLNEDLEVIAFEPNKEIATEFKDIIKSNNIPNITLYEFGLSDVERRCNMVVPPINQGGGRIDTSKEGNCTFITLDSLGVNKADLVKIDVEGHELEVLEGAKDTLKKCRPSYVQIEIQPKNREYKLKKILDEYLVGYDCIQEGVDFIFTNKSRKAKRLC